MPDPSNIQPAAQIVSGLLQLGAVGAVCLYFMWRDLKQRDSDAKENEKREAHWTARENRLTTRLENLEDFCRIQLMQIVNENNKMMRETSAAMKEFSSSVASLEAVIERRREIAMKE